MIKISVHRLIIMATVMVVAITMQIRDSVGAEPVYKGPTLPWLVGVKVTGIMQKDGDKYSVQRVERVYLGPADLMGKTFSLFGGGQGITGGPFHEFPTRVGLNGLVIVQPSSSKQGEIVFDSEYSWSWAPYVFRFPAFEEQNSRYEQIKTLALTLERFSKAGAAQQLKLLQASVTSPTMEVSVWAIHESGFRKLEALVPQLQKIVQNEKLALVSRLAADEELSKWQATNWQNSPARLAVLQQLVNGKWNQDDTELITKHLKTSAQIKGNEGATIFKLLRVMQSNDQLPVAARVDVLHNIATISKWGLIPWETGFDFLMGVIKQAKEREMQYGAARALAFSTFTPQQREALQTIQQQTQDEGLKDALDYALDPMSYVAKGRGARRKKESGKQQ